MQTVYKYPFIITDEQEIELPLHARIVHVGFDPLRVPCLWAIIDTEKPTRRRSLYVRGTGHPISYAINHVGSFISVPFVWHVFIDGGVS